MGYTLLEQVKIRLGQYHMDGEDIVFDNPEANPLICVAIDKAKADVRVRRNYPGNFDEAKIDSDLRRFENVVTDLAVYDCSKSGNDFMMSSREDIYSHSWVTRESLLNTVIPFVKTI